MFVHQFAEETGIAFLESLLAAIAQLLHVVKVVQHLAVAVLRPRILIIEDRAGAAGDSGEEEEQVILKVEHCVYPNRKRRRAHGVVLVEGQACPPADGGDELVLLTDRLAEAVDLNVAGKLGELHLIEVTAAMSIERLEQSSGE